MHTKKKIKILFILPSLRPGGAERVITELIKNLDKEKFDCQLLILGYKKSISYNISNFNVSFLEKNRLLKAIYPLYKSIKKNQPDIVMSSIGHINTVLGLFTLILPKIKFVAREASVVSEIKKHSKNNGIKLPKFISSYLYQQLDGLVCQSKDMGIDLSKFTNVKLDKIEIINNPAPVNFKSKITGSTSTPLKLINIGRLSSEKGQIRILESLKKLKIPFNFLIVGDGTEKKKLQEFTNKNQLNEKVKFIPFTNQINEILLEHDIFLQGSYVEGFPNALVEAIISGLPVVAFEAPGGTREIIDNGNNGFIVKNEKDFAARIMELTELNLNPLDVRKTVVSKFDPSFIIEKYETFFKKIYNTK